LSEDRPLSSRHRLARPATVRRVTTVAPEDAHVVTAVRLSNLGELRDVVLTLQSHGEVVADLGSFDAPRRQRVLDVLSGVAYALDARMLRYRAPGYRYCITRIG
jgi:FtsZ-interacting cell division protein YlmF